MTSLLFITLLLTGCGWFDLGKPKQPDKAPSPIVKESIPEVPAKVKKNLNLRIDFFNIESHMSNYHGAKLPQGNTITVCSAHGCQFDQKFSFRSEHLADLAKIFENVNSAADERIAISKALAQIEMIVGPATGTNKDRISTDAWGSGDKTQLDCVDEATNVTSYLIVLLENNILQYHNIMAPTWKGGIFTWTHYVAKIQDATNKEYYVIDAGYRPASGEPKILKEKDWLN